ncbi:hypothetical protein LTR67_007900 [Exophiala xenobiotica]
MPLIELATVRLHPSLSSSPSPLPSSFSELWTKCLDIASSASGIPFQLYHSSSPSPSTSTSTSSDAQLFYLLGGWQTADDHIAFLSTPKAVDLAKAIGQFMTVDIVRHVDGDIAALLGGAGATPSNRPQRLVVTTYKVPSANIDSSTWKEHWEKKTKDGAGAGGWDESAAVQKQHQAFKQMGQVTNSASAFGGNDSSSDMKTWVWIEDATRKQVDSSDSRLLENASKVEADSVEIEYFIG